MNPPEVVIVIYPPEPDSEPLKPWEWMAAMLMLTNLFPGRRMPSRN